jgi:hypothetical protein
MKPHSSWDGFGFRVYIFCSGIIFLLRIKVIGDSLFLAVGPVIELVSVLDSCLALFYSYYLYSQQEYDSTAEYINPKTKAIPGTMGLHAVVATGDGKGNGSIPTCINIKDLFVVGNDIYYVSIAVL